jgi:hypothetical protein
LEGEDFSILFGAHFSKEILPNLDIKTQARDRCGSSDRALPRKREAPNSNSSTAKKKKKKNHQKQKPKNSHIG